MNTVSLMVRKYSAAELGVSSRKHADALCHAAADASSERWPQCYAWPFKIRVMPRGHVPDNSIVADDLF